MTVPQAAARPDPWPWPDQDADLAAEIEALLAVRDEPAAGGEPGPPDTGPPDAGPLDAGPPDAGPPDAVPPDAGACARGPDPLADSWLAGLPGEAVPGPGAGFGDGGVLDGLGPGPALAGFAQAVLDDGLGGLSDDELAGVLRASRRLAAWQDGVEMVAVAELDRRRQRGRPACSAVNDEVSAELAAALVLTGRSADALMGLARDLARLPAVRQALLEGTIDLARARIFAEELAGLPDKTARAAADRLLGRAWSMTTSRLRLRLRALALAADPAAGRTRAERGKDQARVEAWQEHSGNMGLAGRELAAADALAADARLTAIAQALKDAGAAGTLDQLRAAVFAALLAGRDPGTLLPPPPARGTQNERGTQPGGGEPDPNGAGGAGGGSAGRLGALAGTVHLTMPAAAWLGLSDLPGEAAGAGPIDAWTCRDLAARLAAGQARWQVTLTGPDGRAVATAAARAGRAPPGDPARWPHWAAGLTFQWLEAGTCCHRRQVPRYQPGQRLRNLICVRQRTCSFPGCRRDAARCDLDHTQPYDQDGRTCECNLSPLCRRHHKVKQAGGWTLTQPEPGVLTWTAPHGRSYTVTPEPYPA